MKYLVKKQVKNNVLITCFHDFFVLITCFHEFFVLITSFHEPFLLITCFHQFFVLITCFYELLCSSHQTFFSISFSHFFSHLVATAPEQEVYALVVFSAIIFKI